MISFHKTTKHNRTLLAKGIQSKPHQELEITIGYTGESSAFKAIPLDGEIIPAIHQNNRIALELLPEIIKLIKKPGVAKAAPEETKAIQAFLEKENL